MKANDLNPEILLPVTVHEKAIQSDLFPVIGLSPVTTKDVVESDLPFAQHLRDVMDRYKYSNREVAAMTRQVTRTVIRWRMGDTEPDCATRDRVIKMLTNTVTPSDAMRKHMCKMHNLTWDQDRMRWKLRLTLDMGRKIVGKRIMIHIKAATPDEAALQRNAIIAGYEKLGLTVNVRMQSRNPS